VHSLWVRRARGSTATVWASLALLALTAGGSQAYAQEDEGVRLGITYRPGYVPALAITDIEAEAPFGAVAAAIDSVIARDLDYSDRFEILRFRTHFGPARPSTTAYGTSWEPFGSWRERSR
jgi:hypothetical protein